MRLLSFGMCLVLSIAGTILYLLGLLSAASSYADPVPVWEMTCPLTKSDKHKTRMIVTCGEAETWLSASSELVSALPNDGLSAVCRGYRTRLSSINIQCGKGP